MPRRENPQLLTVREALAQLGVDELKALLPLVRGPAQGRKAELVERLAGVLEKPEQARALYDGLDDLARQAVQEAAHDPEGVWHGQRFLANSTGQASIASIPLTVIVNFLSKAKAK